MEILHGPAAVNKESFPICHWETGKAEKMMNLSQNTFSFISKRNNSTVDGKGYNLLKNLYLINHI